MQATVRDIKKDVVDSKSHLEELQEKLFLYKDKSSCFELSHIKEKKLDYLHRKCADIALIQESHFRASDISWCPFRHFKLIASSSYLRFERSWYTSEQKISVSNGVCLHLVTSCIFSDSYLIS